MTEFEEAPTRRRRSTLAVERGDGENESPDEEAGRRRQRRRRKRRSRTDLDPPFAILFLQVGATLFALCFASYYLWRGMFADSSGDLENFLEQFYDDDVSLHAQPVDVEQQDDVVDEQAEEELGGMANLEPTQAPTKPTAPPLPVWELGNATQYDAFGISNMHQATNSGANQAFWTTVRSLKTQFADLYGGENAVRAMMERGLTTYPLDFSLERPPSDVVHTACRMRLAKQEGRSFRFTFGGYSVTVGRGNYFGQSFPFVMKRIVETPFQLLGINLSVQNAAIGGCPSFPYGFCKKNHWGEDSDVVSWDFSMNEAGGVAEGLEAYLRHTMTLSHRPKLIVKDTHMAGARRELLKRYVELGAIQDPLVLHSDPAVKPFLERREDFRPEGFQNWRKFGSPPGAPGQALHHPAVKEHEMLGWMLAMHFLSALELVAAASEEGASSSLQFTCPSPAEEKQRRLETNLLPPPVLANATTMKEWASLFFGVPQELAPKSEGVNQQWKMNPVHCKTAYDPIVDQSGSLTSVVVSGSIGEDMDVMLPKGHMFYNKGWTFDLSEAEKDAKRKLDRFGGLGYVDSKKAYRGLFTSGTLKLLLPYYDDTQENKEQPKVGDLARDWFQNVIVCEVNERSEPSACKGGKDITFTTGGVNATEVTMLDTPGTLYLGKKICTHIKIPADAKITSREHMKLEDPLLPSKEKTSLNQAIDGNKSTIGLSLELSVHNHLIIARDRACSISHVVWEQRTPRGVRLPLKEDVRATLSKEEGKKKSAGAKPSKENDTESPMAANPYEKLANSVLEGELKPGGAEDAKPTTTETKPKPATTDFSPKDMLQNDPLHKMKADPADSAPHDKLRGVHKEKLKASQTGAVKDRPLSGGRGNPEIQQALVEQQTLLEQQTSLHDKVRGMETQAKTAKNDALKNKPLSGGKGKHPQEVAHQAPALLS